MKSKRILALCILLVSIFTTIYGCSLAPKFTKPQPPVPNEWPKGEAYRESKSGEIPAWELQWDEFLQDPRLKSIVAMALAHNRDLRLAALNVERARALYGIQRAELFPSVNLSATASKQRVPGDLSGTGKAVTVEQYSVNLGIAAWEIDFFGRIRSLKDRALEEYLATEEAKRGAELLLVSETSKVLLSLAADKEKQRIARSTLEVQSSVYDLIKKRFDIGLASELDLRRAQSQVEASKSELARYTQAVTLDINALNLLAGKEVPSELLPGGLGDLVPPREIAAGISSEVLLLRPDIAAAEHNLRAANFDIGAARAALFPRISLTTALGTASGELTGLFKGGSGTWSYMPQLVLPIFDARLWAALDATKVQKEIAIAQYEKVIQQAFKEVADALAEKGTIEDQLEAQRSLVEAARRSYELAKARYFQGLDSYLSVLDAQRSLYEAEQGLVNLEWAKLANRVKLYTVLGGKASDHELGP
jgi:multidrug efflux system outer membrane protein